MHPTRRSVLIGGLSLPLAALATRSPSFAASRQPFANPLVVAVSGADGGSDPARLARLADPFLARKIPLTLTISPFDPDGRPLDRNSRLAIWLRQSLRDHSDSREIGLHLETVDSGDPYFQLRQASEAQAAFSKALNAFEHYRSKAVIKAKTVTTGSPLRAWHDCAAMRGAGIRSVIHLPGRQPDKQKLQPPAGGYWMTETGLASIFGSGQTSVHPGGKAGAPLSVQALAAGVKALAKEDEPIIVDIPFQALAGMSGADLESYANELAQTVMEVAGSEKIRPILPGTLYRQSREKERQLVVVRVDDLRLSPSTDPEHIAFTRKLIEAGYPFTEAVIPAPLYGLLSKDTGAIDHVKAMTADGRYDVATHGWQHTPSELLGKSAAENFRLIRGGVLEICKATGKVPVSYVPPNNAFDQNTLDALAQTGTPIISGDKEDLSWFAGMDRRGLFHVSNTIMFEREWGGDYRYHETSEVLERIGDENDAVFCIHPLTADTPEKKQRIFDTLESLSARSGTKLVNFDEYHRAVVPTMAGAERIRHARADVVIRDWRVGADMLSDAALREDAALAWSYFDWGAKNFNGMAPATSWLEGGTQQGYPFTTMWDVGTYILAAISAHRIDLIDDRTFETTIQRILAFLGETNFIYRGAKLPPTERPLRKAGAERKGFDSADTGRLLIALKILDLYAEGEFPIARLVGGWGLNSILTNGEMHIVKDGRAISAHANSYAGYVGRGYSLWGHKLKPVFETTRPDADMDDAVRALAEIQRRGRIATEPHVTEEIELGGSPHGRLMADILYSAQMKRYEETGILTCVSEGPVTGEPFFVYQGYQMGQDGGHFVVDAPTLSERRHAARRERQLRAVSSKGAYLWYAARPGDYSSKLLELVRREARMPGLGFSSGIPESTGKRFGVSDLNTNGIILEAIAYVLGGRKPLMPGTTEMAEGI